MRYLLILMILCSCSASQKLRKAKQLIAEAEAKGATVKTDSVKKEVTIKGESTPKIEIKTRDSVAVTYKDSTIINKKDTTIVHTVTRTIWKHPKDTTIISNGIEIDLHFANGILTAEAKCPDKKITEVAAVNQTIEWPPENHFWRTVALVLGVILTGILALTYLKPKL